MGCLLTVRGWAMDLESFQIVHPFIVWRASRAISALDVLSAFAELTMEDRSFQGWHHHHRR